MTGDAPNRNSALDILEDTYPHGTLEGYAGGCRTNHCPSPITCKDFDLRYRSDWRFFKRVDAGWTVTRILETEAAEAEAVHEAERAERKRAREAEAAKRYRKSKPKRTRETHGGASHHPWTHEQVERLKELHALGMNDREIGEDPKVGRNGYNSRAQLQSVWAKRKQLGLPPNGRKYTRKEPQPPKHGTTKSYYKGGCRDESCPATPTCGEIGRAYQADLKARKREKAAA